MRNSTLIKSRFFIAGTGKKLLKDHGREVAFTAVYLIGCPHSHMAGIYYLPPGTAANEMHITEAQFLADVAILEQEGFCRYDRHACVIWIKSMMSHQVSAAWKSGDTRIRMIRQHLEALPDSGLILAFQRHYRLSPDGASDGASDGACHGGADGGPKPNPLPEPNPPPIPLRGTPSAKIDFPAQDEDGLDVRDDQEVDP